jgi:hypothetical protein
MRRPTVDCAGATCPYHNRQTDGRAARPEKETTVAKLQTEYEVTCPCCKATLVIDSGLKRVVRHVELERADKPKLDEAHRILADEKARRDSLFEQSVQTERTRGDALSRRFEEALKAARDEPITKPSRDFDLD